MARVVGEARKILHMVEQEEACSHEFFVSENGLRREYFLLSLLTFIEFERAGELACCRFVFPSFPLNLSFLRARWASLAISVLFRPGQFFGPLRKRCPPISFHRLFEDSCEQRFGAPRKRATRLQLFGVIFTEALQEEAHVKTRRKVEVRRGEIKW